LPHLTAGRTALAVALALVAGTSCESPLVTNCTDIGCESGLWVNLDALPTGAFRVEVFANSPDVSPSYVYECTPGPAACRQRIFFEGLVVTRPFIRVTTDVGSVLHEIQGLEYETHRPNGPRCPPECRTAETDIPIPVA
jgi:hypothetical protein